MLESIEAHHALVGEKIAAFKKASLNVIGAQSTWNRTERQRHLMRIELSQQLRAQGKSQKDADDLASQEPRYQEKLLDLETHREAKEMAELDARICAYDVSLSIALLGAIAVVPTGAST